jgi:3-hydroxyisobutyrate dehydrogenase-like beta-hydroxyacid dehydrogenase
MEMEVGFIGLGIMGSRMAANLLAKGFSVTVFNRTRDKAEELVRKGARRVDDPAALAAGVDILVTMLAAPEAVTAVALGDRGFLPALRPGTLWVDCSTVNPSFSRRMAAEAQRRKVRFLDAPAAGTKGPAEAGQLAFFVGGAAADLEEARPLLQAMGRRVLRVGENGMGASLKMVVNLMLGQAMAAFAEGLRLGEALGLRKEELLDALLGGAVAAPFLSGKRQKVLEERFEPEFPLKWMAKDLHLAALTAFELGVALPGTAAAKELYALAGAHGWGEEDFSGIYGFLARGRRDEAPSPDPGHER